MFVDFLVFHLDLSILSPCVQFQPKQKVFKMYQSDSMVFLCWYHSNEIIKLPRVVWQKEFGGKRKRFWGCSENVFIDSNNLIEQTASKGEKS